MDVRSGFGSPLLKLGYLKAFMDGTLGSRDGAPARRVGRRDHEQGRAGTPHPPSRAGGLPIAVHAIGDLANREALDAFEATRADWEPLGLRQRIEHAQLLAPDDVSRFAELGITASVQFSHAPSDRDLADRIWGGTTSRAVRLPLAPRLRRRPRRTAPMHRSRSSIHSPGSGRGSLRTLDDRGAWHADQAVTVEEALVATHRRAGLAGAATSAGAGKLIPGFLADLVVLDRDPLTCEPEELPEVRGRRDDARRRVDAQPAALVNFS